MNKRRPVRVMKNTDPARRRRRRRREGSVRAFRPGAPVSPWSIAPAPEADSRRGGHTETRFKFKVYRKPTNKEDYVHFYSSHSERVKSGIVIGFFLRALRICDNEYIEDEFEHIYTTFMKLKYPKGFLIRQKQKAERIRTRNQNANQNRTDANKKRRTWITIPGSKGADAIVRTLEKNGGKGIHDLGNQNQRYCRDQPSPPQCFCAGNPAALASRVPC